jgi:hypothetical protein
MLASDDPRSYRHATNAHPGQANSPLDSDEQEWTQARIRIVRGAITTRLVPEVYVGAPTGEITSATGVPVMGDCQWMRLTNRRTGRAAEGVVWSWLPGSAFRVNRALSLWTRLFNARALYPETIESEAI